MALVRRVMESMSGNLESARSPALTLSPCDDSNSSSVLQVAPASSRRSLPISAEAVRPCNERLRTRRWDDRVSEFWLTRSSPTVPLLRRVRCGPTVRPRHQRQQPRGGSTCRSAVAGPVLSIVRLSTDSSVAMHFRASLSSTARRLRSYLTTPSVDRFDLC